MRLSLRHEPAGGEPIKAAKLDLVPELRSDPPDGGLAGRRRTVCYRGRVPTATHMVKASRKVPSSTASSMV
ncbi:hypothetical protein M1L60_46515, partial [Actinoplanes sp. TRM 88003]